MTVKGSKQPVDLYTVDITDVPEVMGCSCPNPEHTLDANFADDAAIADLQASLDPAFTPAFTAGVKAYLGGDWATARASLEAAKAAKSDDGPSETLLEFMASHANVAPLAWPGYRELTEK